MMRLRAVVTLMLALCLLLSAQAEEKLKSATLAEYEQAVAAKRPIMLEFGATWCGACMKMKPMLDALEPKWKDRVVFIRFDVDTPDGQKLSEKKSVQVLPSFFFIDASGKVVSTASDMLSAEEVEKRLTAIAQAPAVAAPSGEKKAKADDCCKGGKTADCCKNKK